MGGAKLITLAVNIDNFDLIVVFQVLAQLGNRHVHRASIELVVVNPNGLQGKVALQNFVSVAAKQ